MSKLRRVQLSPFAYHELQEKLTANGFEAANHGRNTLGFELGGFVFWHADPPKPDLGDKRPRKLYEET